MNSNVNLVVVFVVMSVGSALSQGQRADLGSRTLPQWLTGIIAVVGFLFLAFAALMIKHVWCEKSKQRDEEVMQTMAHDYEDGKQQQRRDSVEFNIYTNRAMDHEEKVTAM